MMDYKTNVQKLNDLSRFTLFSEVEEFNSK